MAAMAEIATLSQKQDEVGGLDTYCFRLLLATSPPLGSPQYHLSRSPESLTQTPRVLPSCVESCVTLLCDSCVCAG